MPELPEVETTRRGIAPHVLAEHIAGVTIRDRRLRWPVPRNLERILTGQQIRKVDRRGKYLLFFLDQGFLLCHLGMSGSLRIIKNNQPFDKHDHVDICFKSGKCLRFRDPRRFGALLWSTEIPEQHKLLKHLGPEPLQINFNGDHLFNCSRGRIQSVKAFIMDSRIVTGVGNIYANEALFMAGIRPTRKAGKVSRARYQLLAQSIKDVLNLALKKGGTTLRDFVNSDGNPGYFRHELSVYDRSGEPCRICSRPIRQLRQGQRSSFYCPACQRF